MQINDTKELLFKISDSNIKYFIEALNKDEIEEDSKTSVMNDLWILLNYSKNEIDKKRINKYINKINELKIKEQEENYNELSKITLNY